MVCQQKRLAFIAAYGILLDMRGLGMALFWITGFGMGLACGIVIGLSIAI